MQLMDMQLMICHHRMACSGSYVLIMCRPRPGELVPAEGIARSFADPAGSWRLDQLKNTHPKHEQVKQQVCRV
jgi:hypothetical protein